MGDFMSDEKRLEGFAGGQKPMFRKAAEERARRLGTSPEQVLASIRKAGEQSPYPTQECLQPYEVHMFTHDERFEISVRDFLKRLVHVLACDFCFTLVGPYLPKELCQIPPENKSTP